MPAKLTIADAIDKNMIASANAWVALVSMDVLDIDGSVVKTLRLAKNNEELEYEGNVYIPTDFDFDFKKEANTEPELRLTIKDPTGAVRDSMEDYGGCIGFPVTFMLVNSGNLDDHAEIEEEFEVLTATAPSFTPTFTLGAENPLKAEFPYRRQYKDRCPWPYKGVRCGYSGDAQSCDYTLNGPNGCKAHDNSRRFGGFPGLNDRGF